MNSNRLFKKIGYGIAKLMMMGLIGCGDKIATAKYKNNILLKEMFFSFLEK